MKKFVLGLALCALLIAPTAFARGGKASGLYCSPAVSTVAVGEYTGFLGTSPSASGQGFGKANVWSAPGGTLVDGNNRGYTFVVSYAVPGTYTVTVTNTGVSASCEVIVQ